MVAAGLPPPLVALGSGRHPDDDGVERSPVVALRWGTVRRWQPASTPSPSMLFSSGRTEPLFLAVTMAAVAWLLRVDLSPSWPDPSSGLWVHCEAARGRLGVGASLGDHGASAAPSTLPLSGSGGGHGAAVEAGVCAVGSGGVAGGRQGAGGGLGRSPLPPAPLRL
jgi:hypothetical protein